LNPIHPLKKHGAHVVLSSELDDRKKTFVTHAADPQFMTQRRLNTSMPLLRDIQSHQIDADPYTPVQHHNPEGISERRVDGGKRWPSWTACELRQPNNIQTNCGSTNCEAIWLGAGRSRTRLSSMIFTTAWTGQIIWNKTNRLAARFLLSRISTDNGKPAW